MRPETRNWLMHWKARSSDLRIPLTMLLTIPIEAFIAQYREMKDPFIPERDGRRLRIPKKQRPVFYWRDADEYGEQVRGIELAQINWDANGPTWKMAFFHGWIGEDRKGKKNYWPGSLCTLHGTRWWLARMLPRGAPDDLIHLVPQEAPDDA
jgi:hypothetical protein